METFVQDVSLRETLRSDILKRIPDCDRLAKNIQTTFFVRIIKAVTDARYSIQEGKS